MFCMPSGPGALVGLVCDMSYLSSCMLVRLGTFMVARFSNSRTWLFVVLVKAGSDACRFGVNVSAIVSAISSALSCAA